MTLPAEMTPVMGRERIALLDALRGFALFGILFVNMTWFSGFAVLSAQQRATLPTPTLDSAVYFLVHLLIENKFWSIFALLFGVGFAVLMQRAQQRGEDSSRFFVRRMLTLLAIGIAHATLIWFGDILSLYAITGLTLLLFRRTSDRGLLRWAAVLLAMPVVVNGVWLLAHNSSVSTGTPVTDPGHGPSELFVTFARGTYAEVLAANWTFLVERWFLALYSSRFTTLLGMFLIGVWVGRRGVFRDPGSFTAALRRVVVVGLLVGLPCNLVLALTAEHVSLRPPTLTGWSLAVIRSVAVPALALAYAAGFALLYNRASWRVVLRLFGPAGRVSLTSYVAQSLIGVMIGYGLGAGLWGRVGITQTIPLIILILGIQTAVSAAWLRHFQFGPLEYVLRACTYGRWTAIRRPRPPLLQSGAARSNAPPR